MEKKLLCLLLTFILLIIPVNVYAEEGTASGAGHTFDWEDGTVFQDLYIDASEAYTSASNSISKSLDDNKYYIAASAAICAACIAGGVILSGGSAIAAATAAVGGAIDGTYIGTVALTADGIIKAIQFDNDSFSDLVDDVEEYALGSDDSSINYVIYNQASYTGPTEIFYNGFTDEIMSNCKTAFEQYPLMLVGYQHNIVLTGLFNSDYKYICYPDKFHLYNPSPIKETFSIDVTRFNTNTQSSYSTQLSGVLVPDWVNHTATSSSLYTDNVFIIFNTWQDANKYENAHRTEQKPGIYHTNSSIYNPLSVSGINSIIQKYSDFCNDTSDINSPDTESVIESLIFQESESENSGTSDNTISGKLDTIINKLQQIINSIHDIDTGSGSSSGTNIWDFLTTGTQLLTQLIGKLGSGLFDLVKYLLNLINLFNPLIAFLPSGYAAACSSLFIIGVIGFIYKIIRG